MPADRLQRAVRQGPGAEEERWRRSGTGGRADAGYFLLESCQKQGK